MGAASFGALAFGEFSINQARALRVGTQRVTPSAERMKSDKQQGLS
jgi:hypothetical protein